jgi:hypothetical protein
LGVKAALKPYQKPVGAACRGGDAISSKYLILQTIRNVTWVSKGIDRYSTEFDLFPPDLFPPDFFTEENASEK